MTPNPFVLVKEAAHQKEALVGTAVRFGWKGMKGIGKGLFGTGRRFKTTLGVGGVTAFPAMSMFQSPRMTRQQWDAFQTARKSVGTMNMPAATNHATSNVSRQIGPPQPNLARM